MRSPPGSRSRAKTLTPRTRRRSTAQKADPAAAAAAVRPRTTRSMTTAEYEEALARVQGGAGCAEAGKRRARRAAPLSGNSFARLDRYADAEAEFQEELREFPSNIGTYASLAMLYRASNRDQAAEQIIGDLVEAARRPRDIPWPPGF